ncbi:glucokinase [uncultured Aliiroseovarius sp.]|uniref:glucokinase n=1 Tax=uncultured Aliiroseovarius sp. TaxID=1658783 RepID=UPI00262C5DF4|nr:glucokinase [uncultured Aliiroseovarius sp.]
MTGDRLVADIGGTNSRLGLARAGQLNTASVESFRNDDFASFDDVLVRYLSDREDAQIADAVIAVAGPVHSGRARLTNRDWHFDETQLSRSLGGRPVSLLNDLAALGQASVFLGLDSLNPVVSLDESPMDEAQALVVGIGTGFNVSPVVISKGRVAQLDVEYGHICLPADIATELSARFGAHASGFTTIEEVFSGRGYAALYALEQAMTAPEPDGDTALQTRVEQEFQFFYAGLLAVLTRNLMLAFLPRRGIFFAGGVARNLLSTPAKAAFVDIVQGPFALNAVGAVPVHNILDDAAALKGCAVYAR